ILKSSAQACIFSRFLAKLSLWEGAGSYSQVSRRLVMGMPRKGATMSKNPHRPTKTEQLREMRELFANKGPAVTVESDGSVSVGLKSPVGRTSRQGARPSFGRLVRSNPP